MIKSFQVLAFDNGNAMNTKKNVVIKIALTAILMSAPSLAGAFPVYYPSGSLGTAMLPGASQFILCSAPAGCATGSISDTFNGIPWTGSASSSVALNTADLAVNAVLSGADHTISAQASASVVDTLHFYGAFAPDARAVFTMTATGTAVGGDPNLYGQVSFASMYFGGYWSDTGGGDMTIWTNVISSNCFTDAAGVVRCASSDGTNLSISLDVPLASLFTPNGFNFHMSLECTAYGNASGYGSSSCSYIDPFTITLPAGVTFTSASGQFLTAPVPVPAAAWLFGSGLLGLVGVARRTRGMTTN